MNCNCGGRCRCDQPGPGSLSFTDLRGKAFTDLRGKVDLRCKQQTDTVTSEYKRGLITQHELIERLDLINAEAALAIDQLDKVETYLGV